MKKTILLALALFGVMHNVYAMAPINETNMKAAQTYGTSHKTMDTDKMLAGWTVKDRNKTNKFGNNERAIIYSPYVTVAVNAQNNAKAGKTTNLADSMALAKEYDGILSVGLILNSNFKVEPKMLKIKLYQENEVMEPYATTLENASEVLVYESKDKKASAGISKAEQEKLAAVKKDVEARSKKTVSKTDTKAAKDTKKAKADAPKVSNEPTKTKTQPTVTPTKIWNLQYFTYFDLSKINTQKHVIIKVSDQAGGERDFVLDLPNIK